MSTLSDVLKAMKDVVVINERVMRLAEELDELASNAQDHERRLTRVEVFIDLVKPAVTKRLSSSR